MKEWNMLLIAIGIAMGAALVTLTGIATWELLTDRAPRYSQRWYDREFARIVQEQP
jgi:hypothetical protein